MYLIEKLNPNKCIHCSNQNEFDKIVALNSKNDCKHNDFNLFGKNTVYYPARDNGKGDIFHIEYAIDNFHAIYAASAFIDTKFYWGQILEFSNNKSNWEYDTFVEYNPIKTSRFKYIAVDEYGHSKTYKYARVPILNALEVEFPAMARLRRMLDALNNK